VNEQPKTARSYRGAVVDDNLVLSFNFRFLAQAFMLVGMLVYGYWRIESRIGTLEEQIVEADGTIRGLLDRHSLEEERQRLELEDRVSFYEKELKLNLNPLSWKNKRNKK
tara:strand:+ start:258 stop:587 length:330 start_codon:yes stop_codon:yes gene_type:complete